MTRVFPPRRAIPALEKALFLRNRRRLLRRLRGGVALVGTARLTRRSNDIEHPFRPDSTFYYLTGFGEPEAAALLAPGRPGGAYWLLVRPRHPVQEVWTGRRAGVQGARARYGADQSRPIADLEPVLEQAIEGSPCFYYSFGRNPDMDRVVSRVLRRMRRSRGRRPPRRVADLADLTDEMRLVKDRTEIRHMGRVAAITCAAHRAAMLEAGPGVAEYQVQAVLEYEFLSRGGDGPAYPSIIASGANACTLHYTSNRRRMRAGELLLMDAGCESQCYSADVTRTIPVGGRFSPSQRALYQVVLEAQEAAIAAVRPGASCQTPHRVAVRRLVEGMVALGILWGGVEEGIRAGSYKKYFMHRTSHWLGMDVHDVGAMERAGRPRRLAAGMVLTVEPGLYFPAGDPRVPPAYRGVGIRIEDDVLVTHRGRRVLTAGAPKTPEEIERTMDSRVRR